MTDAYPRDQIGYGRETPDPKWPGRARIARRIDIARHWHKRHGGSQ